MATPNLTAITTVTPKVLASVQLTSGEQTIYTVPTGKAAKLAKLVLTNTSASTVVVSISIVKSGSSAGAPNRVVSGYPLLAGDSTVINEIENVWLGDSDLISANAATTAAITATASGLEFA